jgi:hypothetical protein
MDSRIEVPHIRGFLEKIHSRDAVNSLHGGLMIGQVNYQPF